MRRAAPLATSLLILLAPALASATSPQAPATVEAIEHEVMCPICGTLLELAESPQAEREKAFVAKLAAAGRSRAEIKDALVAQYGPEVLALPKASGFDLSAYLVPILALALAVVAVAIGVLRWRRHGDAAPAPAVRTSGPGEADAERLEADLSRYDL